jgi:hypothetical protein
MSLIVGVDPGIHGALAIVNIVDDMVPVLVDVLDVPVIGTGAKERVNTMLVRDWLAQHTPDHALIERAGSMPKQGVASTFKYARAVGSLETVVACSDIPSSRRRSGRSFITFPARTKRPRANAHCNSFRPRMPYSAERRITNARRPR